MMRTTTLVLLGASVVLAAHEPATMEERRALLALYSSTGGAHWSKKASQHWASDGRIESNFGPLVVLHLDHCC